MTPAPQDPTTTLGIAVAIAGLQVELREARQDIREQRDESRSHHDRLEGEMRAELGAIRDRLRANVDRLDARIKPFESAHQRRQGISLTGKTALAVLSAGVALLTIIALLVALLSTGGAT